MLVYPHHLSSNAPLQENGFHSMDGISLSQWVGVTQLMSAMQFLQTNIVSDGTLTDGTFYGGDLVIQSMSMLSLSNTNLNLNGSLVLHLGTISIDETSSVLISGKTTDNCFVVFSFH